MQTTTQHSQVKNILFTMVTALGLIMPFTDQAQAGENSAELAMLDAADHWQMNRLFEPTTRQREKETQGQVMIYDGLRDTTIKKALDENFARIENMMFTRVKVTDHNGKPRVDELGNEVVEDDGC